MTPEKIGRYVVEKELGRGGMAVVHLARDPFVGRLVAVKVLPRQFTFDPQFRARFQREAQVIATLDHPAIVPVYDFGEDDEQPYIVMRYMQGGSLADKLKANGPLPVAEAARILERVGSALDEAHQKGIVHRDLKPGNILFDDRGDAFVADFGIVKLSESTVDYTGNAIIGTPGYMSPEQARGDDEIDGRSDIYALGAIAYEMLTGNLPYQADTPIGLMMKHIMEPVPDIREVKPDLPAHTSNVISKAMAKEPSERYQHCSDVATALTLVSSAMPTAAVIADDATVIEARTGTVAAAPPAGPRRAAPGAIPADSAGLSPELEAAGDPKTGGRRVPVWAWAGGCVGLLICGILAVGLGGLGVWGSFFGDDPTPTTAVALATSTTALEPTQEQLPTQEPGATATLALLPTNSPLPPPPLPTLPSVTGSVFIGDAVGGSLISGGSDTWELRNLEDGSLDIIVTPEGTEFDVVVDVVDGSGLSVLPEGEVDASFITERVTGVALSYGSTYYVVVRGFDATSAGSYSLWVIPSVLSGTNPGSQIQANDALEAGGDEHFFPFTTTTGNIFAAAIVESLDEEFDAVLGLYNDDTEELLEEVDLSFTKEYLIFRVPASGSYYFKVTGYEGSTGPYETIISGPPQVTFLLTNGDDVNGVLALDGANDYHYSGGAGSIMTIVVRPDSGVDVVIEIYDRDGNFLAGADDDATGGTEELTFTLPAEGRYLIRIRSYGGEAGEFVMTLR